MRNIKPHLKGLSDNDFDELLLKNAIEEPVLVANEPVHVNLPPNNHHNDPVEETPAPAPASSAPERTPHQIFMNKFGKKAGHTEATRNKPKARPWIATKRKSRRIDRKSRKSRARR